MDFGKIYVLYIYFDLFLECLFGFSMTAVVNMKDSSSDGSLVSSFFPAALDVVAQRVSITSGTMCCVSGDKWHSFSVATQLSCCWSKLLLLLDSARLDEYEERLRRNLLYDCCSFSKDSLDDNDANEMCSDFLMRFSFGSSSQFSCTLLPLALFKHDFLLHLPLVSI